MVVAHWWRRIRNVIYSRGIIIGKINDTLVMLSCRGFDWHSKRGSTVMLEIYTGIKLCVLVNFEALKELCDIYLCVWIYYIFLAVLCSIVANSGSLFIAKQGVKFPLTCTSSPVGCSYSVSSR